VTRRVLLTGFEPFGGESINPSWELVRTLAAEPSPHADLVLSAERLPVDRELYASALAAAIEQHRPHAVIAVGQGTGRAAIHLERLAVNRLDYQGARDNGGHEVSACELHAGAPEQLQASLPLEQLCAELSSEGHPVEVSSDAGLYLCNAVLYELAWKHAGLASAFVHIPLLPEQAAAREQGEASMEPDVTRACLRELVRRLADLLSEPDADA
jgi:pyroglutamyl-peptidase